MASSAGDEWVIQVVTSSSGIVMKRLRVYLAVGLALVLGVGLGGCVPARGFYADQFDTTSLSGMWTEVDPVNNGTVSVSGGALKLAVPSGTDHDNWPNYSPVNRTLRVVQNVRPGDWIAETKILNTDIDAGRFAGILVEADSNNFFRSDWDGDGSNVALYVGVWGGGPSFDQKLNSKVGNDAVQWQKVAKVGTTYTISTSTNGSSWTKRVQFNWAPTPTKIGLNVGNSGAMPSYTAQFDYIVNR